MKSVCLAVYGWLCTVGCVQLAVCSWLRTVGCVQYACRIHSHPLFLFQVPVQTGRTDWPNRLAEKINKDRPSHRCRPSPMIFHLSIFHLFIGTQQCNPHVALRARCAHGSLPHLPSALACGHGAVVAVFAVTLAPQMV